MVSEHAWLELHHRKRGLVGVIWQLALEGFLGVRPQARNIGRDYETDWQLKASQLSGLYGA